MLGWWVLTVLCFAAPQTHVGWAFFVWELSAPALPNLA